MSLTYSPCVLIPCYNHGAMMARVLARLAPFQLPCIIVDDGSDDDTRRILDDLTASHPTLTLIRLTRNAGKGLPSFAAWRQRNRRALPRGTG